MKAQPLDGRSRRRLNAMRRVQDAALDLFEARGFAAVTVEEVARAAEVGVASVFRNFGTKEALVQWDAFDPLLFDGIRHRPAREPVAQAVCEATCAALDAFYATEKRRILRRIDLTEGLAAALEPRIRSPVRRAVVAGALVAALTVAIEAWRAERARRPLSHFIRAAFREVRALG